MPFKNITPEGKAFIKRTILNKNNNVLKNTNLKFTKEEYANKVIEWLETHCKTYDIDPNILGAQIHQESRYQAGVYNVNPKTKVINAMGINQFLLIAINDVIFGRYKAEFTNEERDKISNNIVLNTKGLIPGSQRPQTLENVANNPDIMIKAQVVYLKRAVADRIKSDLASVCLYGYASGPAYAKESYGDSVQSALKNNADPVYDKIKPPTQGTHYVKSIFDLLKTEFGFKELDNSIDYERMGF